MAAYELLFPLSSPSALRGRWLTNCNRRRCLTDIESGRRRPVARTSTKRGNYASHVPELRRAAHETLARRSPEYSAIEASSWILTQGTESDLYIIPGACALLCFPLLPVSRLKSPITFCLLLSRDEINNSARWAEHWLYQGTLLYTPTTKKTWILSAIKKNHRELVLGGRRAF